MATKIDIKQRREEIRALKPRQILYEALKEELSRIGHWKQRPRGNPLKAYQSRGKSENREA